MTARRPRRIDAHQHFWRLDRGDYGWLTPALAPIYRDFEPADLAPRLARAGIDETVLVQAAPTVAETRFLLELAASTPFVAGVVGWAPLDAPDAADVVADLAGDSAPPRAPADAPRHPRRGLDAPARADRAGSGPSPRWTSPSTPWCGRRTSRISAACSIAIRISVW